MVLALWRCSKFKMKKVEMYVDLSSSDTGLTFLDVDKNEVYLFSVQSKKFSQEKDKNQRALLKIKDIDDKIDSVIRDFGFDISSVFTESPFCSKKFLNSSEMVLKMHGYILHKFSHLPFSFITPAKIKQVVAGRGNATKEDVIISIRNYGFDLDINGKPNDNVYDSFAVLLSFYINNKKSFKDLQVIVKQITK